MRSLTSEGHITGLKLPLIIKCATLFLSDITGVSPSLPVSDASRVTCLTHTHKHSHKSVSGGQGEGEAQLGVWFTFDPWGLH